MRDKVEQLVIDRIWDISKISPEHGNKLMDILGDEKYDYVMRNHSRSKLKVATLNKVKLNKVF